MKRARGRKQVDTSDGDGETGDGDQNKEQNQLPKHERALQKTTESINAGRPLVKCLKEVFYIKTMF